MKFPTTPCESEEKNRERMSGSMEVEKGDGLKERKMKREGFSKPRRISDGFESDRW